MSMSAKIRMETGVILMRCVPTQKDPTSAVVFEDTREMAVFASVKPANFHY